MADRLLKGKRSDPEQENLEIRKTETTTRNDINAIFVGVWLPLAGEQPVGLPMRRSRDPAAGRTPTLHHDDDRITSASRD